MRAIAKLNKSEICLVAGGKKRRKPAKIVVTPTEDWILLGMSALRITSAAVLLWYAKGQFDICNGLVYEGIGKGGKSSVLEKEEVAKVYGSFLKFILSTVGASGLISWTLAKFWN